MRKLLLLVMAFAILLPATGMCASKKDDKDKDKEKTEEKQEKPKIFYRVYFVSGGVYEAENYTIEKNHIMVQLESGPIFLDKSMVTRIEKFEKGKDEPLQRINVTPATTGQGGSVPAQTGAGASATGEPAIKIVKPTSRDTSRRRVTQPQPTTPEPAEEEVTDDDGHNERWWKIEMNRWIKQREQGIKDFEDASKEWNIYDGRLANLEAVGTASDYDKQRFLDLRGAARIKMDRAEADIKEAENMLMNVLPDKARRAGAPKWWVDWNEKPWKGR